MYDTKQAAALIGTTPRTLRCFLRSPVSTFVAVGSGSRYQFTDAEIPTLSRRFAEWKEKGNGKATSSKSSAPMPAAPPRVWTPSKRDRQVWAEEGPVIIPRISDPRVRARVLADARAAENRLEQLLIANGMHISQGKVSK